MNPLPLNDASASCLSQVTCVEDLEERKRAFDAENPWPVILGQLANLLEEQASLRRLILGQHEQVLQSLSSMTSVGHHASDIMHDASSSCVNMRAERDTSSSPVKESTKSNNSTGRERQKVSGLALTTGKGVYIDITKLPREWATDGTMHDLKSERRMANHSRWFIKMQNLVLQWKGYSIAMLMGSRDDDNGWSEAKPYFEILEHVYTLSFAVEATLRIGFLKWTYLRVPINLLDSVIVAVSCIQMYILKPFGLLKGTSFIAVARLIRLVRLMRFLKVVRFAAACHELRILVASFSQSVGCLCWSMVFVTSLMSAAGIILYQLVLAYVEDESNPEELRLWSYNTFGTLSMSMMALWEVTFSGSWHRYTQKMIVDMNATYALFWVPYIVCINFAVMRLVGALFLKQTMTVAAAETDKMSMNKLWKQFQFAERIREIFMEADTSGDGKISPDEFEEMVYNCKIGACFEQLELEVSEVAVLFELLSAGTGSVDYHEFMDGVLKLKQKTRTIDMIQLIHGNERLSAAVQDISDGMRNIAGPRGVPLASKSFGRHTDNSCKGRTRPQERSAIQL